MGKVSDQTPRGESAKRPCHRALRSRVPRAAPKAQVDDRLVFLGDDADDEALEVMAVELADGGLYVIHAMPLREKYRAQYEEAKRWRI